MKGCCVKVRKSQFFVPPPPAPPNFPAAVAAASGAQSRLSVCAMDCTRNMSLKGNVLALGGSGWGEAYILMLIEEKGRLSPRPPTPSLSKHALPCTCCVLVLSKFLSRCRLSFFAFFVSSHGWVFGMRKAHNSRASRKFIAAAAAETGL